MDRIYLPIFSLLFGASLWGISWLPFRALQTHGLEGPWVALVIYIGAVVVGLFWGWRHFGAIKRYPGQMALLAITAGWTNVAFILAMLDGNIMRVLLLFYLSPLWAVLLARMFLHERLNQRTVAILIAAVIGVVMMIWHPGSGFLWPISAVDWLALSSGLAFAASNVVVRKAQRVSIQAKAVSTWIGVVMAAAVVIVLQQTPVPTLSATVWFSALAFGAVVIVLMTVSVQYGVTQMPIQRSAIILLFELVAGAISQALLTDETMTLMAWGGGGIIIVAGYLTIRYGGRAE